MTYLSADAHQRICADPNMVESYYVQLWRTFAIDLGSVDAGMNIGAALLPVAFAAIVAWDLKPYGPEPTTTDLRSLLDAPSLACDDYVRLAWYLTRFMPQVSWAPVRIVALGWNGGAVGNHAQMLVSDGKNSLLLDPTIGLIARDITFDSLAAGFPVLPEDLIDFSSYRDDLHSFRLTVRNALLGGKYRPGDLLYYVGSLETYTTAMPNSSQWLTPQIQGVSR